ncbi:MAG TPA: type II toxin-antitoxin system prevent-host-death family antitoxin [Solirubrobacteraceae bacterium]
MGTFDPDWIQAIAARNLIVIGRDKRIRTRPAEVQHLVSARLRVFRIGGKKDATTWGWLTWLVHQWDEIEKIIRTRGPGPWFYVVYEHSIVELPLRQEGRGICVSRSLAESCFLRSLQGRTDQFWVFAPERMRGLSQRLVGDCLWEHQYVLRSHMDIGVRDLRNQTGRVIDAVRAGERVTLTVHGEPVADIVPHERRARWLSGSQSRRQLADRAADPAGSHGLRIAAYCLYRMAATYR